MSAVSLDDQIEKNLLECLNQANGFPVENVFQPNTELQLHSDSDHQLLIKVSFRSPVKINSIRVLGEMQDETAPKTIKVFQNKNHIGFSEAEDEEPTQVLNLTEDHLKGKAYELRFVKFQSVTTLQLFVEDNFGAEVTKISRIEFLGANASAMNMQDWKPCKG